MVAHEGLEQDLGVAFDLFVARLRARDGQAAHRIDRDEFGGRRMHRKALHVAAEALRDEPRGLQHRGHRGMVFGRNQDGLHGTGFAFGTGYYIAEPLNERGAGATTWGPAVVTFITARPRWLEPSLRKRNTPSIPVKPDGLVSTSAAKRCCPWVLTSAATSATAS